MAAPVSDAFVWPATETQSPINRYAHSAHTPCPCYADIDECASGTDSCAHSCQDSIGSYICLCNAEFILSEDGRSCEGKRIVHSLSCLRITADL